MKVLPSLHPSLHTILLLGIMTGLELAVKHGCLLLLWVAMCKKLLILLARQLPKQLEVWNQLFKCSQQPCKDRVHLQGLYEKSSCETLILSLRSLKEQRAKGSCTYLPKLAKKAKKQMHLKIKGDPTSLTFRQAGKNTLA